MKPAPRRRLRDPRADGKGTAGSRTRRSRMEDSLTTDLIGVRSQGRTLYMNDSRNRDTGALFAIDTKTNKATLLAEDAHADVGGLIIHPARRQGAGRRVRLPPHDVEGPRQQAPTGSREAEDRQRRRPRGHEPQPRRQDVDRRVPRERRADEVLPLRSHEERGEVPLLAHVRARGAEAREDDPRARADARRATARRLPHAAGRLGRRRRRQAGQGAADGALHPRRTVGARRVGLQRVGPVARVARLRGAQRQLPRLDGLREVVPQRGRSRMGRARCTTTCSTRSTGS